VIEEKELRGLSGLVALDIPEQRIKAVLENFRRIQQVAQAVNEVELGAEDEIGPEWRP
jgi:Asp-tRNA(Asn)/Glu-tRNA(Gln) amidotransferase C subunit